MELKRTPVGDKVLRGFYEYYKANNLYCEEEFEIYKNRKKMGISIFAQLNTRIATGEFLSVYIDYQLNKDFVPTKVLIEKTLGQKYIQEIFSFNIKSSFIDYFFVNEEEKEHHKISTGPKFAVVTPATCTSLLSLKTRKEDPTSRNFYNVLVSNNNWNFNEIPIFKPLGIERVGLGAETIQVGDHSLSATVYRAFAEEDIKLAQEENIPTPHGSFYASKYYSVPYMVKSDDGLKIQIKYLNDLDHDK